MRPRARTPIPESRPLKSFPFLPKILLGFAPLQKNSMTLKTKFRIMIVVSAAGLLAVAGFWIQSEHSTLIAQKQEKTKNLVDLPYSIIEQQYHLETEGKISRIEAQRRAIDGHALRRGQLFLDQ